MFAAAVEPVARTLGPAHRQFHRLDRFVAAHAIGGAFVKRHDNVGAQKPLDFHRAFGRQHMFRPVEMALERHALFGDFAQRRQAHHLIPAAVGQYRAVPARKLVQPTQPRHTFRAGPQHQMVGVAQDDVRTRCAHFGRAHRLYRGGGADGHEGRRANFAAHHLNAAGARLAIRGGNRKLESRGHRAALGGLCAGENQLF